MEGAWSAAVIVPVAVIALLVGWLFIVAYGRRPVRIRFKGLGLEVSLNPCGDTECPLSGVTKG